MDNREYFNNLAFKWDEICYHDEAKLKKIIELAQIRAGSKILDVGTGTGVLVKYLLASSPSKIVAVDIAENMIKIAKEKYKNQTKVEFKIADILKFKEKAFDYIFLYSVYPHFKDKDKLFNHLVTLLNEGGKLIIAHSESKEEINSRHAQSPTVENDVLAPAEITVQIMSKYLRIEEIIDNQAMYFISGQKFGE